MCRIKGKEEKCSWEEREGQDLGGGFEGVE
jgi:hypothetical protein